MKRPYVILVSAVTLDGRIASKSYYSRLSCPHDLKRLHTLRAQCDAVMIGANTALIDDPMLTVRYVHATRQPIRVVVDGRLRIHANLRLVKTAREVPTVIFTSSLADRNKIREIESFGAKVEILESYPLNLQEVLKILYEKYNVRKLLVEGGGTLNWNLLREDLIDEMYITVTTCIFGAGTSIFHGEGFDTCEQCPKFTMKSVMLCECGQEVVIHLVRVREGNLY